VQGIGGRPRLVVTADGAGIVSHAGTALLGGLADRVGLTGWLDEGLAVLGGVRRRGGGHRPGRVLSDLAVMIADGPEAIADIAVLADQPGLHGRVGSPATCWRVLKAVADRGPAGLDALARGRRGPGNGRGWPARSSPVSRSGGNRPRSRIMIDRVTGAGGGMVGRRYLLRGEPVTVITRWAEGSRGPRNVLLRYDDGRELVRPFRGLRRTPPG